MRPAGGGGPSTLYLVDGNAQFHRAYHAIRGLSTSRGLPTNATYGFTTMLRKLEQDEKPTHIGISFDPPGPTFRHEQYAEYKANRKRMDDDLAVQLPYVRRVCEALKIPILELPGFEADDVIATLSTKAVAEGWHVVVVSGDKDLLQLVSDEVTVLNPGREGMGAVRYDRAKVEEKWGVPPERIVDVLALMGDSVDNIPGVAGIGDKGARDLVREYGAVEAVLDNADKVKRTAYREGLKNHRAEALLSKQLATLRVDVPIALDLEALRRQEPDRAIAHAFFSEVEFAAIAKEYVPDALPSSVHHRLAASEGDILALVSAATAAGRVSVAIVGTAAEPMRAQVLGIALAVEPGGATYVPLAHTGLEGPPEVPPARALELLKPLFESAAVHKLSANAKRDLVLLARAGQRGEGWTFDALVAAYLLNPGRRGYSLDELSVEFVNERRTLGAETAGPGAPAFATAQAAGQDADLVLRMSGPVTARLAEEQLDQVYASMEMPLIPVLADLERAGVKIDTALLASMSHDMEGQLEILTREIHTLAKGEFNINSPVQLREILFDRLGLQSGKKTAKTRAASTAEEVLEELALVHELPRKILDYRAVQKLKSTYVDALPALVNPGTGRIHASFNQTVAATGRISASDPNLQNIPIRTREGRRIREAFVAEPGHLLLSADYSQIELRILAHLSKDETLIDTFRKGEDVHDRTSREIFGPLSQVPPGEQRRISKMVNYALLYGKTAFTLAKDIGVSRKEAQTFIEAYFARYPAVRRFIDLTIEKARETGHVRTLLGRLRRLPDLRSRNVPIRMEAERQAMNTPVQGSAADLIKKAMIDLHRELASRGLETRLILQIHDELLLEAPAGEAEQALRLVKETMEGALVLDVPLVADARIGRNWAEVH